MATAPTGSSISSHRVSVGVRRPNRRIVTLGHLVHHRVLNFFLLVRVLKGVHFRNGIIFGHFEVFLLGFLFSCLHLLLIIVAASRVRDGRGLVLAEHDRLLKCSLLFVVFLSFLVFLLLLIYFMEEGADAVLLHLFLSCLRYFL